MNAKTIATEIDAATSRLADAAVIDQKQEMIGNIYPLLKMLTQSQVKLEQDTEERIGLCEDAVAEMISGADDRIHDRLATRIQTTVAIAAQICEYATKDATTENPPPDELMLLIQTFRDSAAVMMQMVDEVLVDDDDEDGLDDENEEKPDGIDSEKE